MATIEVKQRGASAKPDPLANWHQGDIIAMDGDPYIVARIEHQKYALVSIRDGNRWSEPPLEPGMTFPNDSGVACALLTDPAITITHS